MGGRDTTEEGLAGLLITPGPYGCGCAATAPPRRRCLTLLALTPGSEPRLLVPSLEHPDAEAPGADAVRIGLVLAGFIPFGDLARAGRWRRERSRRVVTKRWSARRVLTRKGARLVTEDVQYASEKFYESVDRARNAAGEFADRAAAVNPFG